MKTTGLNGRMDLKLQVLREVEGSGNPGGGVKRVDVKRETGGGSGLLGFYWR